MPLTADEMVKLSKAIFHAEGLGVVNGQLVIDRKLVMNFLNDYSPDCKAMYSNEEDGFRLSWKIRSHSSAAERLRDMEEAEGSNPSAGNKGD